MSSAPEWLTALASVAALLAAGLAVLFTKRLYEVERGRDHRAIARLVSAWPAELLAPNGDAAKSVGLSITNCADTPVHDLIIKSNNAQGQRAADAHLEILPPGRYFQAEHPRYIWAFAEDVATLSGRVRPVTRSKEWVVTSIEFTDSSGTRWLRDDRGHLNEIGAPSRSTTSTETIV